MTLIKSIIHWEGISAQGSKLTQTFFGKKKDFLQYTQKQNITTLKKTQTYQIQLKEKNNLSSTLFIQALSDLLSTGLSLLDALSLLLKKNSESEFQTVIQSIITQLNQGNSFSTALQQYPTLFSQTDIFLIHAAENTNQLPSILKQLADQHIHHIQLKNKLKKAMLYPTFVLVFALLITVGLLTFAIPQFAEIFNNFNATLPLVTRLVIQASDLIRHHIHWIIAIPTIFIACTISFYRKSKRLHYYLDKTVLKIPFFKTLIRMRALSNWTNVLSICLKTGINLTEGIDLANQTITNHAIKTSVTSIVHDLKSGQTLNQALSPTLLINLDEQHLIEIGESSATLDIMLTRLSTQSSDTITNLLESLSKWIEPVIMIFLAILAGGLIIAMYLPIFKIGTII